MVLERYARRASVGRRDKVIRTRIPADLYDRFKTRCDQLGLTISEAIFLLIQHEVDRPGHEVATSVGHDGYIKTTITGQEGHTPTTPRPRSTTQRPRSQRSSGGPSGVYAPYVVNGRAPCPLCESWVSRSNVSRHMQDRHNTKAEIVYNDSEHKEKAKRMAAEARGENGEGPED